MTILVPIKKLPDKDNLKKEGLLGFTVVEGPSWRARHASHSVCSRAVRYEMWLPMFKVGLSVSVKPFWKNPHGHTQQCVAMAILNPVMWTAKINHQSHQILLPWILIGQIKIGSSRLLF